MRDEAGLLVGVAPQDLRGRVRHIVHRHRAQLQAQADMGHLQQDHGPVRAGPQDLLHQAQVGYLHRQGAVSEALGAVSTSARRLPPEGIIRCHQSPQEAAAAKEALVDGLQGRPVAVSGSGGLCKA